MKRQKLHIIIWGFFIICILILALLDLESMFPEVNFARSADLRHVLTFAVFVPMSRICFPKLKLVHILAISLLFAGLIELFQEIFTNGARNFTWSDIWFDITGIAIGFISLLALSKIKSTSTQKQQ